VNESVNEPGRFSVEPTAGNHFAWTRTRLALERTFMAWIRTAVSLISFGFTIVQFFQRLPQMQGDLTVRPLNPDAPRILGLSLIGAGVVSLAISSWQYRKGVKYLWSPQFGAIAGAAGGPLTTPVMAVAMMIILIGLFAFLSVLVRLA
jgi:putative membrane protein